MNAALNVECPFCGSHDVELVSAWGGQMITSQVRCRACTTYFEAIREQFAGPAHDAGIAESIAGSQRPEPKPAP